MINQEDIQKLIINHTRRLYKLQERKALEGITSDPKVLIEIEDIEKEIEHLKTKAKELAPTTTPVDQHYDKALHLVKKSARLNNRLELLELIGLSYYGQIWRAWDNSLERQLAILLSFPYDDTAAQRFLIEARVLGSLSHPHVLGIYDFGQGIIDNIQYVYLVMPFAEGGSLHELLKTEKGLSLQKAKSILTPVCSAIEYMHSKFILHRNLKSTNILFDKDQRVLVSGLGISLARLTAIKESFTVLEDYMTAYMAPELLTGSRLSQSADVYSLGIILLEMLTGKLPSKQEFGQQFEIPPDAALPEGVKLVIKKATQLEPTRRYQSVTSFLEDFATLVS